MTKKENINTSVKKLQTQRKRIMKKYNTESNLIKRTTAQSKSNASNKIQKELNSFVDMKGVNNKTNKIKNASADFEKVWSFHPC